MAEDEIVGKHRGGREACDELLDEEEARVPAWPPGVALGHLLACGCVQQVVVAELIHAVVVPGAGEERERRA